MRRAAGWAVSVLAAKPASARELCGSGCLHRLQQMENTPGLGSVFSRRALEGLLGTSLEAKFWTLGRLSEWDSIEDGFYEVGPSCHSLEFMSLEELSKLPLSDRLTAVCVNSRPEEEAPAVEEKKEETGGKERSKSRKGADSKSSKKGKPDREQKEEEEVTSESLEPPFSVPIDQPLQELVQEVTTFARSAESGREVARLIAQLVSTQMGGEVEK